MDGEERTYVCDDVRYEYSEKSQMLFIWLFNDDTKYKKPNHFAKYDFGRSADKEDRKMKLFKGIYREPFKDGWKYTINSKLHSIPTIASSSQEVVGLQLFKLKHFSSCTCC